MDEALRDRLDRVMRERDEALALLREVIASAVTFADARVRYVEVQIDLPTFYGIKATLAKRDGAL